MKFLPVCAIALGLGATQVFAASAAEGKTIFDAHCKMCHKADGSGIPAMKMRPLGSAEVQSKSNAELEKDITGGVGKMRPQHVTPAQAADLVAFIRTLKK